MAPDTLDYAEALWRATVYVSVVQLHLNDNVFLRRPLTRDHVKSHPSGHWGTVPGTAWTIAHLALVGADNLVPIFGAGHAGIAQVSFAWLTGHLQEVRAGFSRDELGLKHLAAAFPELAGLGSEINPGLPGGRYVGGCLGGAFSFAQGFAAGANGCIAVPILGDGECETPTTSAAWMANRAFPSTTLPIIHLNGFRMGGRSLLGGMSDDEIHAYATGQGWSAEIVVVTSGDRNDHHSFRAALLRCMDAVTKGTPTALFLRCRKGWGITDLPEPHAGCDATPLHKTPFHDPRTNATQLGQLETWLASYHPESLFNETGSPAGTLASAIAQASFDDPSPPCGLPSSTALTSLQTIRVHARETTFGDVVAGALHRHAAWGDFRLFSPDELASNRLGSLAREPWAVELLAEEILLGWLMGWLASNRRGAIISYEAFAPLFTASLMAHLKQRRMPTSPVTPSLNIVLTSYGWHNVYTHGDPSFSTMLLAACDPAVHILTPADPQRLRIALDEAFASRGRVNVVIAGKHATAQHPVATLLEEQRRGLAVWTHLSDEGPPDVTLIAVGDLPADVVARSVPNLRHGLGLRVRVVSVFDITVLGNPNQWPKGLSDDEVVFYLGDQNPILVVTLGHPAAIWGLIEGRWLRPVEVLGWREPPGPLGQADLSNYLRLDPPGVTSTVMSLMQAGEG